MKKIFNNKMYDTNKATLVAKWWNGYDCSDFKYERECVYRTAKGTWFLHCEGGAQTRWAESSGNSLSEGEGIVPLDEEHAMKWLAEHGYADQVMEFFPDQISEA